MAFNVEHFLDFCAHVCIDSKEQGVVPLDLLPVQRYLVDRIAEGLNKGVHSFAILKSRQEGITTLLCALDIYWAFLYPGTKAALIASDDDVRVTMRLTINSMVDSIPETSGWKYGTTISNRTMLGFTNRSHMYFAHASKDTGDLGRSKGLNLVHGTELGLWKDPSNYYSLKPSLAKDNPNRLYLWEGTAKGLGLWWDIWRAAIESDEEEAIFLGWWLNPARCLKEDHPSFSKYWDGRLAPHEEWVHEVKERFGIEITAGQLAWYRKVMNEEMHGQLDFTWQEYPPLPELAFQTTSSIFFPSVVLSKLIQQEYKPPLRSLRFEYASDYSECKAYDVDESLADLRIWQYPVRDGSCWYVIGADSAWGTSDKGDAFCATVWRCWANRMEQVAEFHTKNLATYQFAWLIAYLGGQYKKSMLVLELAGGGAAVFQELQRLMAIRSNESGGAPTSMLEFRTSMINYLYRRPDSMSRPSVYHWKTTGGPGGTKERMMHLTRDLLMRGVLVPRSREMMEEMAHVVQEGASFEVQKGNDDRVMSAAMAVVGYVDSVIHSVAGVYWTPQYAKLEKQAVDATQTKIGVKTVRDIFFDQFYNHLIANGIVDKQKIDEMRYGKPSEKAI